MHLRQGSRGPFGLGLLASVVLVACQGSTSDPPSDGSGGAAPSSSSGEGAHGGHGGTDSTSVGGGGLGTFVEYEVTTSSYFDAPGGGSLIRDVAFDSAGNFVVVGGTHAPTHPTTPGAYDTTFSGPGSANLGQFGDMDVFVAEFDHGGELLWSTFLGGPSYDRAYAVEVGPDDDIYVAGRAGTGFPTTSGAMQENFAGDDEVNGPYGPQDGFIARMSPDGSVVRWSSFIGGVGRGFVRDIDVDDQGDIYLALSDVGGPLAVSPSVPGPAANPVGGRDGYLAKVSGDGTTLLFGTYIGGTDGADVDGTNPSVRVAPDGGVYFVAYTEATDVSLITPGAVQPVHAGQADAVLVRFDAAGSLVFGTYLGGSGFEGFETHSLAVGSDGVYVAGGSSSQDFPVTAGAAQPNPLHNSNGFVTKVSFDGATLLASTYVSLPAFQNTIRGMALEGLAVTPSGDVVAGGSTRPANGQSGRYAVMARVAGDLASFREVDVYGGGARDEFRTVEVAPDGAIVFGGHTDSSDYPTVNAYDEQYSSGGQIGAAFLRVRPVFASP